MGLRRFRTFSSFSRKGSVSASILFFLFRVLFPSLRFCSPVLCWFSLLFLTLVRERNRAARFEHWLEYRNALSPGKERKKATCFNALRGSEKKRRKRGKRERIADRQTQTSFLCSSLPSSLFPLLCCATLSSLSFPLSSLSQFPPNQTLTHSFANRFSYLLRVVSSSELLTHPLQHRDH